MMILYLLFVIVRVGWACTITLTPIVSDMKTCPSPYINFACLNQPLGSSTGLGVMRTSSALVSDDPLDPSYNIFPPSTFVIPDSYSCRTVETWISLKGPLPRGHYSLYSGTELDIQYWVTVGRPDCDSRYLLIPNAGQRLNTLMIDMARFQSLLDVENSFLEDGSIYQLTYIESAVDTISICIGRNGGFFPICLPGVIPSSSYSNTNPVRVSVSKVGGVYYTSAYKECLDFTVIRSLYKYVPFAVPTYNPEAAFHPAYRSFVSGSVRINFDTMYVDNRLPFDDFTHLSRSENGQVLVISYLSLVYVYTLSTAHIWTYFQGPIVSIQDILSLAVDSTGYTIVAGGTGSVAIFKRTTGLFSLVYNETGLYDHFGESVGISEDGGTIYTLQTHQLSVYNFTAWYALPDSDLYTMTNTHLASSGDYVAYSSDPYIMKIYTRSTHELISFQNDVCSLEKVRGFAIYGDYFAICRNNCFVVYQKQSPTEFLGVYFEVMPCTGVGLDSNSVLVAADGVIYVYPLGTTWNRVQTLRGRGLRKTDGGLLFGSGLVASGNNIIFTFDHPPPVTSPPTIPPTFSPTRGGYTVRQSFSSGQGDIKIAGSWLAIGDPTASSNAGCVRMYSISSVVTESAQSPIVGSVGLSAQRGLQIALTTTQLLFSGEADDSYKGAIWYFELSDDRWVQRQGRFRLPDPYANDRFGSCLSFMNSTNAIVGAGGRGDLFMVNLASFSLKLIDSADGMGDVCSSDSNTIVTTRSSVYMRIYSPNAILDQEIQLPGTITSLSVSGNFLLVAAGGTTYLYQKLYVVYWTTVSNYASGGFSLSGSLFALINGDVYSTTLLLLDTLPSSQRVALGGSYLVTGTGTSIALYS